VAYPFVWYQLEILSTERVAVAGGEIGERHLVSAADLGVEVMNLARESVWRKPFAHCTCVKERSVNSLCRRLEHTVKFDGVCIACCHDFSS
jgi:hypothetical protein